MCELLIQILQENVKDHWTVSYALVTLEISRNNTSLGRLSIHRATSFFISSYIPGKIEIPILDLDVMNSSVHLYLIT